MCLGGPEHGYSLHIHTLRFFSLLRAQAPTAVIIVEFRQQDNSVVFGQVISAADLPEPNTWYRGDLNISVPRNAVYVGQPVRLGIR